MEARIVERDAFRLIGVAVRGDPTRADYSDLWQNRYAARMEEIAGVTVGDECYGAYFATGEEGIDNIMAGRIARDDAEAPAGLVCRAVPAATYACFDAQIRSIGATWGAIFGGWLPTSGYEMDPGKPSLEVYPPTEVTDHAEAPVIIMLPVRKRSE